MNNAAHASRDVDVAKGEVWLYEARLNARLDPLREALAQHPIYERVNDLRSLRAFMTSHVFAVWDFMSLLKALQRSLTCVEVPWMPPENIHAARLINTIVVGEETDEVAPGAYTSHFSLYLEAMDELSADRGPIDALMAAVRGGRRPAEALDEIDIPASTRDFVRATLHAAEHGLIHEVAASFLHGREDLVPMMFRRILGGLAKEPELACVSFRRYLERHVDVDEGEHGPMARELLRSLCGDDEAKWEAAAEAAAVGLTARLALWDGVLDQLELQPRSAPSTLRPPRSTSRVRIVSTSAQSASASPPKRRAAR